MEIGHIIANLRTKKKISQKQLAKDINVSSSLVGLWETNKRLPSLDCFISLIDYFAISADVLLEKDRALSPVEYKTDMNIAPDVKKILDTFELLNNDNRDILIGEAKKLLKSQRLEEKRESLHSVAK